MIPAAELDRARADIEADTLPDVATVQTSTVVSDGGGGSTRTWADRGTAACRVAPVGGGETGTTGGRIADQTTHIVTLPASTVIEEADRLLIAGRTFDVTLVRERGEWELARRAEVREAA